MKKAGTIDSSDTLAIGSPNYPALSRTYVGSPNGLRLSAGSRIGGNLYAPTAASGAPVPSTTSVQQGATEASNVDLASTMSEMIDAPPRGAISAHSSAEA